MAKLTVYLSLALVTLAGSFDAVRAQEAKDSSGTNPAILSRQLSKSNEYRFLADDYFFNVTNFRYTEPFADGKASIRLTIPVNATDLVLGDTEAGLGDIAAKLSWVPYISRSQAFILSSELYAPTASEEILGTGKWVIAPGITWANFVSPEVIVAPALIYNTSFAGDDEWPDVNRTDFDLYVVYKPHGKPWWITSDVTVSHDFEGKTTPIDWELTFGRSLMQFEGGGALNGYIRPGIGIGHDRPYNFNIEVGINLINF
jgi:hypothetical protein